MYISPQSSTSFTPQSTAELSSPAYRRRRRPGHCGNFPGGSFSPAANQNPLQQMLGLMQGMMQAIQSMLEAVFSQLGGSKEAPTKAYGNEAGQQQPQAAQESSKGGGLFDSIKEIGTSLIDKGLSFLKDSLFGSGGGILGSISGFFGKLF